MLGGGGIRGIAHIGMLEVFQQANIPIDTIVGCSMGAIIGALYADCLDAKKVLKMAYETVPRRYSYKIFGWPSIFGGLSGKGFFSTNRLEKIINQTLSVNTFEELKLPLKVVATNLNNGQLTDFCQGAISKPICASFAVPGFFKPVQISDHHYVDGSVITALPVALAKETDAELVLAMNLRSRVQSIAHLDVISRSYAITRKHSHHKEEAQADIMLHPNVHDVSFFFADKKNIQKAYEEGKREAEAQLPTIQSRLREFEHLNVAA